MNNNKNRSKDRRKNNAELRKMQPKDNANMGIVNGKKIGVEENKQDK